MPIKNLITGLVILSVLSLASAFGLNYLSPKGIALFGQWDPSKGAIHAKSKQDNPSVFELEIKNIQTAKQIFDRQEAIFVDARVYEDYADGHIPGAVSMPVNLFEEKIPEFLQTYELGQKIVTYCSGRECEDSHQLAMLLMNAGYTNVRIFIDGFPGWEEEGYPVEK